MGPGKFPRSAKQLVRFEPAHVRAWIASTFLVWHSVLHRPLRRERPIPCRLQKGKELSYVPSLLSHLQLSALRTTAETIFSLQGELAQSRSRTRRRGKVRGKWQDGEGNGPSRVYRQAADSLKDVHVGPD
jgi:hypothetical protein